MKTFLNCVSVDDATQSKPEVGSMDLRYRTIALLFTVPYLVPICSEAALRPSFRDLVYPMYVDHIRSPVAVIRVRHSVRDHLQKGFFKFGVFPILRVDRLSIDVHRADRTRSIFERTISVLSNLQSRGKIRNTKKKTQESPRKQGITGVSVERFELRRFEEGRVRIHLTASQASKFGNGNWKLRNGKLVIQGREEEFARATLQITEDDFVLQLPSASGISLFSPMAKIGSRTKETETRIE